MSKLTWQKHDKQTLGSVCKAHTLTNSLRAHHHCSSNKFYPIRCHHCGSLLIGRDWYQLSERNLTKGDKCLGFNKRV